MPKLDFIIDKEKDAYNIWQLCNLNSPYEERTDKKQLDVSYKKRWEQNFDDCKQEIQQSIVPIYSSGIIEIFKEGIEKGWGNIQNIYFNKLESLIKKPIYPKEFKCYVTTAGRCTHNPEDNSIIISIKRPLLQSLRTIGHELMHLQFYHDYKKEFNLTDLQFLDISESLTVLLNLEFKDLWFVEDVGYEQHKELRNFISEEWVKEKDFEKLLEKCIKYLER